MRICFSTDGKLREVSQKNNVIGAELYAFAFGSLGEVDYEREIAGVTNEMEEVALFSHHFSGTVMAGCYTNTKGICRRSAIVADGGKILGVSDETYSWDGEKYNCGTGIRVYDTSAGKIGVIIGKDLYFSDLVKSLSECGAELIVCLYEELRENIEQLLIRADSFRNGVPICLCAHGFAQVSDVEGRLSFASPKSISYCKIESVGEYHLIQTRKKGFYRGKELF